MNTKTTRVTLKVIAEHCGYSVNTVSRALRGDKKLPAQTIEKIQNVAQKLGYIRNNLASGLRSGHRRYFKSPLLSPDLTDGSASERTRIRGHGPYYQSER